MGYALAETALELGANVTLVSGPVNLSCSPKINRIDVVSAEEMYKATIDNFDNVDIGILCAAVADYTPTLIHSGKLKKEQLGDNPVIELKKTPDILASLGKLKNKNQLLIGFALETDNLIENASSKLNKKNCDAIIANRASSPLSGFGGDFNTISIIGKNQEIIDYFPMTKLECADIILKYIIEKLMLQH